MLCQALASQECTRSDQPTDLMTVDVTYDPAYKYIGNGK
jgi:hypothetical protein